MKKFIMGILGFRPYADNTTSTVGANSSGGPVLVEKFLSKEYLKEREFNTPLANSKYMSNMAIPKMAGQYIQMTRRKKLRQPEVARENLDPNSGAQLAYEQINVPIEFINDYIAISTIAQMTSWIDLAKDAKELTFEAIKRYMNTATQAALFAGRFKPGLRDANGVTIGDATNPHFWATREASPSLYGNTFNFQTCPHYYANGRDTWANVDMGDRFTMADFTRVHTRLKNSGAKKIDGKYVAVISDSIKHDLEQDDEYFAAAIRSQSQSAKVFDGELADYGGLHWVLDDEPWTLEPGATNQYKRQESGRIHVAHIFGQDCFGYLKLGGKDAAKPEFKVQNISKTGATMTIGYLVPFQAAVTNRLWGANLIGPVSEPGSNE